MSVQQEFVDFVNSQAPDKVIDNSEAWCKCAIGEFAKSTGNYDDYLTPFAREVCGRHTELWWKLNMSEFSTYGELQEYLRDTQDA